MQWSRGFSSFHKPQGDADLSQIHSSPHKVAGELCANCFSLLAACWDNCVRQLLPDSGSLCPDGKSTRDLCRRQWRASVPTVQGSAGCHDHSWCEGWGGDKEHSKISCKRPGCFVPWVLRSLWAAVLPISRRICIVSEDTYGPIVWGQSAAVRVNTVKLGCRECFSQEQDLGQFSSEPILQPACFLVRWNVIFRKIGSDQHGGELNPKGFQ